ncbi:Hypothetical predicted protein [Olea europaea subsp. europaea]|uniref:Uncharacterized protein n=1 Tax=Olea europaea subsp. europaea TaxID=158383 RepID=A0A8S0PLA5_OLEEU|nr:Hypothetical predicted protein [Olea europaea subsp. europaea]
MIGSSIHTAFELDVYQTAQQRTYDAFFKNIKLHVSATLRPIEVELGQPYISTLLPFEDRTVPVLDDVARDIIPSQHHPEPLANGVNVGNSRGSAHWFPVEEAPRTMRSRATVMTREPVRRLEVIRVETAMESPRTRGTGLHFYPRPPSLSRSTPPTAQAANEPTVLGSLLHDGNGGEINPVPECAEPQVHGRGFSPLSVDHDEDMDKETQERNGGAGMESELAMIGDDDEVASGGSGKREDDRVAFPTGVAEAKGGCGMDSEPEKNSDDDEVPSDGSGNCQDKPIASASGVAEVDGK